MKKKRILIVLILVVLLLSAIISIVSRLHAPQSFPAFPDDKAKISKVKWFICNLTARGFSDWVFVENTAEIPYQEDDFRNPEDYSEQIKPPTIEKVNDRSVVTLYTWNEYGGLLSEWKATIDNNEITFLHAEVIQVAVGHHTPLSTEGRFLPTPGVLLVNESPSSLKISDKVYCRRYQTNKQKGEIIEVSGRIYTIGNEPFTQLVIESVDGAVYGLINTDEITRMVQGQVKVRGYLLGRTPPSFRTEKSIDVIDFEVVE